MRIPPETIRSLVGLHAQRVSKTTNVGAASSVSGTYRTVGAGADGMSLSDEASLLNTLKAGVKAMPDVDASRVQQVSEEISRGTFQVPTWQVAEGLVMELGGAR